MKRFFFLLFCPLLFTTCEDFSELSNVEILVTRDWQNTSITTFPPYLVNGIPVTDLYYAILPECERDDIHIFTLEGKKFVEPGASLCVLGQERYEEATWSVNEEQTQVTMLFSWDNQERVFDIKEVSETEIHLEIEGDFVEDELSSHQLRFKFEAR